MPSRSAPTPLRDAARLIAEVTPPAVAEPSPAAIEAALGRVKLTSRSSAIAREILLEGLDAETALARHKLSRPDLKRLLDTVTTEARTPPGWRRIDLWLPEPAATAVEDLGRQAIGLPPKRRTARSHWRAADRTIAYDPAALAGLVKAAMQQRGLTYRKAAAAIGLSSSQMWRVTEGDPVADEAVRKVQAWLEAD